MVKIAKKKKVNSDKYFETKGVLQYRTVQLEYRVRKQSDNTTY
jgi:hypothetical protein